MFANGAIVIVIALLAVVVLLGCAHTAATAPASDADTPTAADIAAFEEQRAVYLAQAKEAYPTARERFVRGLPEGSLFMVARFGRDADGSQQLLLTEVVRI